MKIIICDDDRQDAQSAKQVLIQNGFQQENEIFIYTPQELKMGLEIQDLVCDVLIMDIEYDHLPFTGIQLSKEINQKLPLCQIVYLTWVLEFAPAVYETTHCYFVLKENMQKMLPRAMEKAIQVYQDEKENEIFVLREQGKTVYIRQNDIVFLEREERKVTIHTVKNDYHCYLSLSKIIGNLGRNFLRSHGGYIVNYNYIESVMRESIILVTGKEIPIGRTYQKSFHEQYIQIMQQHI